MTTKQVILWRKDLVIKNVGKLPAQAAHASTAVFTNRITSIQPMHTEGDEQESTRIIIDINRPATMLSDWLSGIFTKIVLAVENEKDMRDLYEQAKSQGLLCSWIVDSGRTEFDGVPTATCCAIGPDYAERIDPITGHLKLLASL